MCGEIRMSKIKTVIRLIKTPQMIILPLAERGLFKWMSDEPYLCMISKCVTGQALNLKQPMSFTDKVQWLKLHDHQERYIELVDKLAVKEYVRKKIGNEYIVPTLAIWDNADEICFDSLPPKFVIKCNHDSGSIIKCFDKATFNAQNARSELAKRLRKNAFDWGREWPYKYVNRKIFAEELLEYSDESRKDLVDYKFYCFGGKPMYCQVITERATSEKIDFYDMDWKHQPFVGLVGLAPCLENSKKEIKRPQTLDKMIQISSTLSEGIPFCRVDFYEVEGRLYFGEITFFPNGGFGKFVPDRWNNVLGSLIEINVQK